MDKTISSKTQEAPDLFLFHSVPCERNSHTIKPLPGLFLKPGWLSYLLTSILILMAATSRPSEENRLNEQTIYIIWSLQLHWLPFYVQAHWCVGTIILSTAVQWTEAVGFYNPARLNFSGFSVNLDCSCSLLLSRVVSPPSAFWFVNLVCTNLLNQEGIKKKYQY